MIFSLSNTQTGYCSVLTGKYRLYWRRHIVFWKLEIRKVGRLRFDVSRHSIDAQTFRLNVRYGWFMEKRVTTPTSPWAKGLLSSRIDAPIVSKCHVKISIVLFILTTKEQFTYLKWPKPKAQKYNICHFAGSPPAGIPVLQLRFDEIMGAGKISSVTKYTGIFYELYI